MPAPLGGDADAPAGLPEERLQARPVDRRGGDLAERSVPPLSEGEWVGQRRNIFRPIPQGRDDPFDHAETVIQVLPEAVGLGLVLEAAIGGRHHPHIDLHAAFAADAANLEILEHPQQLGLQMQGHLADLVEEECPVVGQFERSPAAPRRAGKGPLLVAGQFTLEQWLREGRAVDGHEGPGRAGTFGVDRPAQVLLAHAGRRPAPPPRPAAPRPQAVACGTFGLSQRC